jgi:hypothetical protein
MSLEVKLFRCPIPLWAPVDSAELDGTRPLEACPQVLLFTVKHNAVSA